MTRPAFQISLAAMLGMVACVAVNLWLFRVGFVWGLVGLNVTKHVGVAVLCQVLGVNQPNRSQVACGTPPRPHARFSGSP